MNWTDYSNFILRLFSELNGKQFEANKMPNAYAQRNILISNGKTLGAEMFIILPVAD